MQPRQQGDPWYTALYRDPHTLWWAPGAIMFGYTLLLMHWVNMTKPVALLWACLFAGSATSGILWRRRRSRG